MNRKKNFSEPQTGVEPMTFQPVSGRSWVRLPSTDTSEVFFLVKNTLKRNVGAEDDSKLRITAAKFLLRN